MEDRYRTFRARGTAGFVDGLVFIPLGIAQRYMNVPERGHTSLILWLIFSNSAIWMYSVFMHAGFGQTIGKMVAHVKVFDVSEQRIPSLWQALLRDIGNIFVGSASLVYVIYLVSADSYFLNDRFDTQPGRIIQYAAWIWFLIEMVTMFTNNKRRAFHDYVAGTVVVDEW